jgi:outer membrane protein OmpA-like peptidoglycan-associated protein
VSGPLRARPFLRWMLALVLGVALAVPLSLAGPGDGLANAQTEDGDVEEEAPEPVTTLAVDIEPLPTTTWRFTGAVTTSVAGRGHPDRASAEVVDPAAAEEAERSLAELGAERTPDGLVVTLPETILFEFDSAELVGEADETIARVGEVLTYYDDADIEVRGHTDSRGEDDYNQRLSEERAAAVRDALTAAGVPAGRLTAVGLGASDPIAPNETADGQDDPEGREQNRRVEVVLREG